MNDRALYEHRQTGWSMLIGLIAVGGILAATRLMVPASVQTQETVQVAFITLGAILVLTVPLFGSLRVRVTTSDFEFSFGVGLIRKTIPLSQIASFKATRTPRGAGWGIHTTRAGRVYNVSGFESIELKLADGTTIYVGTDDTRGLSSALRRSRLREHR